MKIWLDVLTGKDLLFAEPIIKKLEKKNHILCTRRDYRELNELTRIRGIKTVSVGRHGGKENLSKLIYSARRINRLAKIVHEFQPNLAISFQSPEAARVAFGLGIKHVGFSDSDHASAVMKLTVPYLNKLLIPWILKKKKFAAYGISEKNILKYKAIDGALISKRSFTKSLQLHDSKIIVIRMAEEHASYNEFANSEIVPIIDQILKILPEFRIVVLPRYADQIRFLKNQFGKKIKVVRKVPDSKDILRYAAVFIGSGGTMTAEAAFLGIPTISYSSRSDYEIDVFLANKKIIVRESNPKKIPGIVQMLASTNSQAMRERAKKLLKKMEEPFPILQKAIES